MNGGFLSLISLNFFILNNLLLAIIIKKLIKKLFFGLLSSTNKNKEKYNFYLNLLGKEALKK
jgi:hypothetical protein